MRQHRRQLLRGLGAALVGGVAGCQESQSGGETTGAGAGATSTPTPEGSPTEAESTSDDGQYRTETAKLAPDDGDAGDQFGFSVALSSRGSTALVGALLDDDPNGEHSGAAYVFERDGGGGTSQAKLAPDDGRPGEAFGNAVALSRDGSTALVGAPAGGPGISSPGVGSAYRFERTDGGWEQTATAEATGGERGTLFGAAVALSADGSTALVGEPADDGTNVGSATVLTGERWERRTRLAPADRDEHDQFGAQVALSERGSTALVGAQGDDDPNGTTGGRLGGAGSASVFERSDGTWSRQAKLAPDDGEPGDWFGSSVALSVDGSTALVGAQFAAVDGADGAGAAYVYEREGAEWAQRDRLTAEVGERGPGFGWSVALAAEAAVIGVNADNVPNGPDAGSAYLYRRGAEWSQQAKLVASDGDEGDRFGWSAALSRDGKVALVGARNDEDPNGASDGQLGGAGSAYSFDR